MQIKYEATFQDIEIAWCHINFPQFYLNICKETIVLDEANLLAFWQVNVKRVRLNSKMVIGFSD